MTRTIATVYEVADWKLYLVYIAKENKKIERYNKKKWDAIKVKQEENQRLSDEWEKQDKLKREAYKAKQDAQPKKKWYDLNDRPFYMPYYSHNPYKWQMFYPYDTQQPLKPVYEDFLTLLAEGKLLGEN